MPVKRAWVNARELDLCNEPARALAAKHYGNVRPLSCSQTGSSSRSSVTRAKGVARRLERVGARVSCVCPWVVLALKAMLLAPQVGNNPRTPAAPKKKRHKTCNVRSGLASAVCEQLERPPSTLSYVGVAWSSTWSSHVQFTCCSFLGKYIWCVGGRHLCLCPGRLERRRIGRSSAHKPRHHDLWRHRYSFRYRVGHKQLDVVQQHQYYEQHRRHWCRDLHWNGHRYGYRDEHLYRRSRNRHGNRLCILRLFGRLSVVRRLLFLFDVRTTL